MRFDLARFAPRPGRLARVGLGALAGLAATFAVGCSSDAAPAASADDVVVLPHTDVKNQSIGNCWLYASASWVEALHAGATGEQVNLSESYWSYLHWFLQIYWSADPTSAYASLEKVQSGGFFHELVNIVQLFGAMAEGDFIPEEATAARSGRQSAAERAVNASLKSGVLADRAKRGDWATLRAELDAAFQLSPEVIARLDLAIGRDEFRTAENAPAEARVLKASQFQVLAPDATTHERRSRSLAEVLPDVHQHTARPNAWTEVSYPRDPAERRAFLVRLQRALHDGVPPLLTFQVDFAAMKGSSFAGPPAAPGRQGAHMVAVSDYEVENVPGFGTLPAGKLEERPEALEAALSPEATLSFIRVKNSWGATSTASELQVSGHYDLHLAYLDGPVSFCLQPDGSTDRTKCQDTVPFTSLVLPAGY